MPEATGTLEKSPTLRLWSTTFPLPVTSSSASAKRLSTDMRHLLLHGDTRGSPVSSRMIRYRMSPEEFRRVGHQLIDWVADYRAGIAHRPILAPVEPGAIRAQLPAAPPADAEPFD